MGFVFEDEEWEAVGVVNGTFQAEILRGLLESQGVEVVLSQESAGRWAYALTVGPLSRVEIFVPVRQAQLARQILADYEAGKFAAPGEDDGAES